MYTKIVVTEDNTIPKFQSHCNNRFRELVKYDSKLYVVIAQGLP
jgi:hypothetical protein